MDGHVVTRSHGAEHDPAAGPAGGQHGQGSRLGYCPQHDPLLDLLTAREQLALYARLKVGFPASWTLASILLPWRRVASFESLQQAKLLSAAGSVL